MSFLASHEDKGEDLGTAAIAAAQRKAKGGEEREKSPDQGAVVTMATASAPAPLELCEGVGFLLPSFPPTLTATFLCKTHSPDPPRKIS